jgi:hypothetical protein
MSGAVAGGAAALALALAAPVAQAHTVSNPQTGTLGATISSATLTLGSVTYPVTSGSITGGSVDPSGGLSFPSLPSLDFAVPALASVPGLAGLSTGLGTLTLSSAGPLGGAIDPSTGAADLAGTLSLVEHVPVTLLDGLLPPITGTLDCTLASVPLAAASGSPGGSPYDQATGAMTLADDTLAFGTPVCTTSNPLLAAAAGALESALGLAAGTGQLDLGLLLDPILQAGPIAVLAAVPAVGTVPFSAGLDAAASVVPAGVKEYDWDTNDDGVTDVVTPAGVPTLLLPVQIPGLTTAAVRVVDSNGDSDRATTLLTGLLGIVTGGGDPGAGATTGATTTGATTTGATTAGGTGGGSPAGTASGSSAVALDASRIVSLPSARRCVSRRRLRITLRAPAGTSLRSATVRIGKGRTHRLTGNALRGAAVNLSGLPKGRYVVVVRLVAADGRSATLRRTYRTCAKKARRH